jgi:hypothetical protein
LIGTGPPLGVCGEKGFEVVLGLLGFFFFSKAYFPSKKEYNQKRRAPLRLLASNL